MEIIEWNHFIYHLRECLQSNFSGLRRAMKIWHVPLGIAKMAGFEKCHKFPCCLILSSLTLFPHFKKIVSKKIKYKYFWRKCWYFSLILILYSGMAPNYTVLFSAVISLLTKNPKAFLLLFLHSSCWGLLVE